MFAWVREQEAGRGASAAGGVACGASGDDGQRVWRFIKASITRRAEEEDRYRILYQRSLARDLTHRAETAQDPVLALLLAIEVIERSPDAQADRLVRTCLSRLGPALAAQAAQSSSCVTTS
jgi:hypothetical protein